MTHTACPGTWRPTLSQSITVSQGCLWQSATLLPQSSHPVTNDRAYLPISDRFMVAHGIEWNSQWISPPLKERPSQLTILAAAIADILAGEFITACDALSTANAEQAD